uniref:Uncharacterized protein n=1 Tax=Coturnix japonica TaxID=93934 RepID=A0A8C2TVG2_COTJA
SPACMLCGQTYADPDICGPKQLEFGICAHVFCMVSSPGAPSFRLPPSNASFLSVTPEDVQRVIQEAEHKHCFICGELGAPITCAETGCEQSFHLSCTRQGECVTQYFGEYRDRPSVQASTAFSAPSAEIRMPFYPTCLSWASESHSGWCFSSGS